ncbi:MAG TPA: amino acid adenylation domain-containing protein [Vicinamibacterales bacterium]
MAAVNNPESGQRSERQSGCRAIERALLAHPSIVDCAVLERTAEDGGVEFVAYVAPVSAVATDDLRALLEWGGLPTVAQIVGVTSIPLTVAGVVDRLALSRLPVHDTLLLQTWERRAATVKGVERAALLLDNGPRPLLPLHLSDLLDDWAPSTTNTASSTRPADVEQSPASNDPALCDGGPLEAFPDTAVTLDEALTLVARTSPHGLVYATTEQTTHQSYAELLGQAERILGGLQARGLARGDRVVLQLERQQDFIETFWACVLGGFVPVPLAVPGGNDRVDVPLQTLRAVWTTLGRAHIVTVREAVPSLLSAVERLSLPGARVHAIEDLRIDHEGQRAVVAPDDLALLMLTSGSTGTPKAVMLTHRNILSRTIGSRQLNQFSCDDVSVNWMPLDHVAGLIFFHIRDIVLGCRQVHLPTRWVLEDPLRWIDSLDRFRATVTFAPNFAFALVNDRAREIARRSWDLSRLRLVLNGAEAIVARTARTFLKLLGPHRLNPGCMCPAWGMSETSSGVIYGHGFSLDNSADDDPFVEVGRPIAGVSMRIVDVDDRILHEGTVGRLQVRGPVVMEGYLGSEDVTRESFTRDGWFKTGDLGLIRGGRLTITGREKDVVIVNSVNYYCHAIESAVEAIDGVETSFTAACAVRPEGSNTDRLAIFFQPGDSRSIPFLLGRIRAELSSKIGIAPDYIIPVAGTDIPKTSVGKIQRSELARRFVAGEFDGILKQVDRLLANGNTIPDWFFRKVWRPKIGTTDESLVSAGSAAVIFADGSGLGEAIRSHLERRGMGCTMVRAANRFTLTDGGDFTIDPREPSDYERLLTGLSNAGRLPDHILHLWGYGAYAGEAIGEAIEASQFEGALSALWLVQALARARPELTHLTVVASHSQGVRPGERVGYEKAPAIALMKSMPQELPWLQCRHVDMPPGEVSQIASLLLEELCVAERDREVAFRDGDRLVSALEKIVFHADGRQGPVFVKGGAYLIAGGMGGIGERVAEFLVQQFGARLLLTGRGPLDKRREAVLERLRTLGGTVAYESLDVCDEEGVAAALDRYATLWGSPFDGAIHLAGTYYESLAVDDTAERFLALLKPKALGTESLQRALTARGRGVLISWSSIAGFFGGASIGTYAAANAFQEAFAAHFQERGLIKHYCLSWSNWNEIGQSRDHQLKDALRARGYRAIAPAEALQSLTIGLTCGQSRLLIGLDGGHRYVRRACLEDPDLLEQVLLCYTPSDTNTKDADLQELELLDRYGVRSRPEVIRLAAMPVTVSGAIDKEQLLRVVRGSEENAESATPRTDTERELAAIWKEVLGVASVGRGDNFFDLGGDSLLAARVVALMHDRFGRNFTLRTIFDSETLADLANRVGENERPSTSPPEIITTRPLTSGQRALWFLHQMAPKSGAYNIAFTARVTSPFDLRVFEQSLQLLVERHEGLRTVFPSVRGEPVQQVQPAVRARVDTDDTSAWTDVQVHDRIAREIKEPFALSTGPLTRVRVYAGAASGDYLSATFHHIIMDGWSLWVCLTELGEIYRAAIAGQAPALSPTSSENDALERSEHEAIAGEAGARHLAFWRTHLGQSLPVLNLPTDRPRPPTPAYHGRSEKFRLGRETTLRLKALVREGRATPQMALLTLWQILLHRYSSQQDLMIGYLASGRTRKELEPVVGYAANLLPLRLRLSPEGTFRETLKRNRDVLLEAFEHQEYPFLRLVDQSSTDRDVSRSPLFQVLFVYEKPHLLQNERVASFIAGEAGERMRLGPLELESLGFPIQQEGQFDLTLMVVEVDDEFCCTLDYNTDLFDASTIRRAAGHLQSLARAAVDRPDVAVAALSILSETEQRDLRGWNGPRTTHGDGKGGIHQLIELQAAKQPEAVAVSSAAGPLSYSRLNGRANRLARYLVQLGVGPNTIVGLLLDRSTADLIVAMVAILKAGGAFLPLDLTQPIERLKFMLADSGAALLVTQSALLERVGALPIRSVELEDEAAIDALSGENLGPTGTADDLAYVIYTSGSTGKPKGVLLEHRGLWNVAREQQRLFGAGPGSHVMQFASMSFDAAVFDVVMALCSGGTLHLASKESILPGLPLLETLKREKISILTIPPSALAHLPWDPLPALKILSVAGEACPAELVARWSPGRRFFNLYGPSEATIWATFAECTDGDRTPPIGQPIANTQTYVLDSSFAEVPIGVAGELYLGGHGLARGYLNRPELTAQCFIQHRLEPGTTERLYKTGDLVRRTAEGQLLFMGRVDDQVKLRGFRIELGEIETELCRHPAVGWAVAMVREDEPGVRRLVAYMVPSQLPAPHPSVLKEFLRVSLPDYMLPTTLVFVDEFPLTPSGKVDRSALPPPETLRQGPEEFTPPASDLEQLIAQSWKEVLRIDRIGAHDNFFDIGGNSLLMAQVHARLTESVRPDLSIVDLFQFPTIGALAAHLDSTAVAASASGHGRADGLVAGQARLRNQARRRREADADSRSAPTT